MLHCEHAIFHIFDVILWDCLLFSRDVIFFNFSFFNFLGISISFDWPWLYNSHYKPFVSIFSLQSPSLFRFNSKVIHAYWNTFLFGFLKYTLLSVIVRRKNFVYNWIDIFCSFTMSCFLLLENILIANSIICEIFEKEILHKWRRAKNNSNFRKKLTFNLNDTNNTDLSYDNVELHLKKWKFNWSRTHAYIKYLFTGKR